MANTKNKKQPKNKTKINIAQQDLFGKLSWRTRLILVGSLILLAIVGIWAGNLYAQKKDLNWAEHKLSLLQTQIVNSKLGKDSKIERFCDHPQQGGWINSGPLYCNVSLRISVSGNNAAEIRNNYSKVQPIISNQKTWGDIQLDSGSDGNDFTVSNKKLRCNSSLSINPEDSSSDIENFFELKCSRRSNKAFFKVSDYL